MMTTYDARCPPDVETKLSTNKCWATERQVLRAERAKRVSCVAFLYPGRCYKKMLTALQLWSHICDQFFLSFRQKIISPPILDPSAGEG